MLGFDELFTILFNCKRNQYVTELSMHLLSLVSLQTFTHLPLFATLFYSGRILGMGWQTDTHYTVTNLHPPCVPQ